MKRSKNLVIHEFIKIELIEQLMTKIISNLYTSGWSKKCFNIQVIQFKTCSHDILAKWIRNQHLKCALNSCLKITGLTILAIVSGRPFQYLIACGRADELNTLVLPKRRWKLCSLCRRLNERNGRVKVKENECSLWTILCNKQSSEIVRRFSKSGSVSAILMLVTLKCML